MRIAKKAYQALSSFHSLYYASHPSKKPIKVFGKRVILATHDREEKCYDIGLSAQLIGEK